MDAGYYSSEINIIRDVCSLNDICGWYRQGQILWESGNTVETVVGLHRKNMQKSLNLLTLWVFYFSYCGRKSQRKSAYGPNSCGCGVESRYVRHKYFE